MRRQKSIITALRVLDLVFLDSHSFINNEDMSQILHLDMY